MPRGIMDNRTRELAPEINTFLADGVRAHFAVGHFFLSGFRAIAAHGCPALTGPPHPVWPSPRALAGQAIEK